MTEKNEKAEPAEIATGHPKGLYVLFSSEMFERLCYYGMRGLLVLFLTKSLLVGDKEAYTIYGAYTALVYMAPVAGGKLADLVLGYKRAVVFGGIMMAIGEFVLLGATHPGVFDTIISYGATVDPVAFAFAETSQKEQAFLFAGMALIIIGNGFFKANISTIVGRLYNDGDPRRDAGFTIFYIGINLGALIAGLPVIGIAPLGERFGFFLGFLAAGIGMICAIAIFIMGQGRFEGHGEAPDEAKLKKWGPMVYGGSIAAAPLLYIILMYLRGWLGIVLILVLVGVLISLAVEAAKDGTIEVRQRLLVLVILMFFNVVFWACFEQAGSSLTLFADRYVDRDVFGVFTMSASAASQFFNPAFILLFGSVFSVVWARLAARNKDPSIPMKFGLGIIQLGAGYMVMVAGAMLGGGAKVGLIFLALMYMLHTTGELFLSPIGLSMVTKLAPKHMTGSAMGAWFLSFAFANFVAAALASMTVSTKLYVLQSIEALKPQAEDLGIGDALAEFVIDPQVGLNSYVDVYGKMGWVAIGCGVLVIAISPLLKKMMHGVK